MTQVSFLRHNQFFGPEDSQDTTLNIIGVGATGSWVGLLAAKMGWHKFKVWDPDFVESHNCSNQIYDASQVGMKKVDAFEQVLKRFNPQVIVEKHHSFFKGEQDCINLQDAVFVAVDSLSARKDIFSHLQKALLLDLVFETKMGFTHAELNIIDPEDNDTIKNFISTLKDDKDVAESACNARIITTLTTVVASTLVHQLCNYYSSSRRGTVFNSYGKILFHLPEDGLTVFTNNKG